MNLTTKQKRFIQLYNGNATEAAKRAGYSERTANEQGCRLLANVNIKKLVDRRIIHRDGVHIATREERQKFWAEIMNNPELDYNIRMKASELLGKSQADFTENVAVTGEMNIYEVMKDLDITAIIGLKNRLEDHVPAGH